MLKYILPLIFLISCSVNFSTKIMNINNLKKVVDKNLNFFPKKALYANSDLLYVSSKNFIYIFEHSKMINKIGGYGFEDSNFSKLTDFTISDSGELFALDALQKEIKIFDKNGSWLNTSKLKFSSYPLLLDISSDAAIYIYDSDKHKILVTKDFSETADFSFAEFDFENPISLTINENYLTVNTKSNGTFIYDISGQLVSSFKEVMQISNGILFSISNGYLIKDKKRNKVLYTSLMPINAFFIKNGYFTIISNKKITILKPEYE